MSPDRLWLESINNVVYRRTFHPNRDISDPSSNFYMECVAEKRRLRREVEIASESSAASFSSALLMSPREPGQDAESGPSQTEAKRELPPYTIDSLAWEEPGVLDDNENGQDKANSIMDVLSKVYSVAKIVEVSFVGFDIDTDNHPTGLVYHIRRAESIIKSTTVAQLKETVEDLYYAVYARLIIEMANAELCSSFTTDSRQMTANNFQALPEPSHMYKIYLSCKEILDSSSIRSHLNANTIRVCQERFFHRMASRLSSDTTGLGFTYDNYGEYVVKEVSNDQSAFCSKWLGLAAVYRMPSAQILALLSEKYLSVIPKAGVADEIPIANLPFVNPNAIDPVVWERQIIHDNRQATLAKLEGKSLGDVRREGSSRPARLFAFVEERKCICSSACTCAMDCTMDVERACPCAPRILRTLLVQLRRGPSMMSFASRCGGLAKALFDGLAVIRREVSDADMIEGLSRSLQLIGDEIRKERGI